MQTFIARLNPDKIALYEQIHDEMTAVHADSIRSNYHRLDIFRIDEVLIMLVERRPEPLSPATDEDKARGERWHASLAECFAEGWRPSELIFSLATAGK